MRKNCYLYTFKLLIALVMFSALILLLAAIFEKVCMAVNYAECVSVAEPFRVVIDAGHGGRDGGAVSINGIFEKDLNLSLAGILCDYLVFSGIDCVMTRTGDSLVCDEGDPMLKGKLKMTDLKNRLTIAEENPNSIFVSIHMNKFPIEKYRGLQVYYSSNNEKSATLASCVQDNVRDKTQVENSRECKAAGSNIYILDRIKLPAILVECGFLSNREESVLLSSVEYQTKLALAISEGIFESMANN